MGCWPLRVNSVLRVPTQFTTLVRQTNAGLYEIENRLKTALNGVYSLRVSGALVGMAGFTTSLEMPFTAAYEVSKHIASPVLGVYGYQLAKALTGDVAFTQICKSSVTVTSYHVVLTKQTLAVKYALLDYTPVRRPIRGVYNISQQTKVGLTTLVVVKF